MGGQNHQPTNQVRLIAPSAWLSQRVGEAFSQVLRSNSALENAIIVGMQHLHVEEIAPPLGQSADAYLGEAVHLLEQSLEEVDHISAAYANLLAAADLENYKGNPLASKIKSFALDEALTGELILPGVNPVAWKPLEHHIYEGNILSTLKWEATEFERVREPTNALLSVLEQCKTLALEHGELRMVEAIECNEVSLRQEFAKVFSLWNYLHGLFLYSAVAMTELFYRTNAFGSLMGGETQAVSESRIVA